MRSLHRATGDHQRARELAAVRQGELLETADAAWLDSHLAGCADCAGVAAAYDADHLAFGALREAVPMPPRDLWARTAASLDAEPGARVRLGRPRRSMDRSSALLAPIAGIAVVAIVVGSGLLNGSTSTPGALAPSAAPPTPIAMTARDVSVLSMDSDGGFQIQTRRVDEVCPLAASECQVEPSFEVAQVAGIGGWDSLDAIISPTKDSLVLVQRGTSGSDGVFVVPVTRPTASPPPSPPVATVAPATPKPTPDSTPEPATGAPSVAPTEAPSSPDGSPSEAPSESPLDTPPATPEQPTTPSETQEPTPEPTPVVAVTPVPGGAVEIASNVIVVGSISGYNADGSRFAFTARPADGSAGPDVYVWNTDDTVARAVTTDHRSVLAGWDGRHLLVSRVVDGTPRTFTVNAKTGEVVAEQGRAAWLPTIAPSGDRAAWWDGSVRLADDGVTWAPESGRLVVGSWPDPVGGGQVLVEGGVPDWQVRWAPDGSALAVWIAGKRSADPGLLDLYAIDPETGRVLVDSPLLKGADAFEGFSLQDGHLAWSAPGNGGDRTVQVLGWEGDAVLGGLQLPAAGGATVVR